MRVLYLSYDGALDPLGASQVIPYLEGLASSGHTFVLQTFEKPDRWAQAEAVARTSGRLERAGIEWDPLPYTRRPPAVATAWDLARGLRAARERHRWAPFDLVHVRSYPGAVIARTLRHEFGVPYLFDMRGFYAEERVDGGLWRADGPLYRVTKRLEAGFLRDASGVVTLTEASLAPLQRRMVRAGGTAPVYTIPTSVDLNRFSLTASVEPSRYVYIGSLGTWYRADAMVHLARSLLRHDASAVVEFLLNGAGDAIAGPLAAEISAGRVQVGSVPHENVPSRLAGAAGTFALIQPAPSKVASAPTKVGESLAMGIPVLVNAGVGDGAAWVRSGPLGVVAPDLTEPALDDSARRFVGVVRTEGIRERCRAFAERHLSLSGACETYARAYEACVARSAA